ncbi:hypothetical protein B0H66DRAFT_638371 [Apodospora peruviana]|uniref:Uncharacterized protein n=1 Tax=Apodospora peruviana TaxID=516989 RepID=A0AAE0ICP6_9PEZI|nr:hypothetical protein B0H66DRAFT_638371 [Apodospora peruviana]
MEDFEKQTRNTGGNGSKGKQRAGQKEHELSLLEIAQLQGETYRLYDLLKSETVTIDGILNKAFSPFERELLGPAQKSRNPALVEIQAQNKKSYSALLNDLAFKLTLAYFGLPVAPMTIDFQQQWVGYGEVDDVDEHDLDLDEPPGGYLHFLNDYHERMSGKNDFRMPDRLLEKYHAFEGIHMVPSGRGSGLSATLGLRGGDGTFDDISDRNDGATATDLDDKWLDLCGYQGLVWFRLDSLDTFVDAVDRLLGLDNRAGAAYTISAINLVKLNSEAEREFLVRNSRRYSTWCQGVGDYSQDSPAWQWILDELGFGPGTTPPPK